MKKYELVYGGWITKKGYRMIHVPKSHKTANYRDTILEHRYVIEQYVGRYLTNNEAVHHINGDKLDNRIENLQLMTKSEHGVIHATKDMSNRICLTCGSTTTYIQKNGTPYWTTFKDGYICAKCRNRKRKKYKKFIHLFE